MGYIQRKTYRNIKTIHQNGQKQERLSNINKTNVRQKIYTNDTLSISVSEIVQKKETHGCFYID